MVDAARVSEAARADAADKQAAAVEASMLVAEIGSIDVICRRVRLLKVNPQSAYRSLPLGRNYELHCVAQG